MGKKRAIAVLALALLPGVSSAALIDSALRFWSFDGTLSDSAASVGASAVGWSGTYVEDRDGNMGAAVDLTGELDAILVDNSIDLPLLSEYSLSLWFRMASHNGSLGRSQLFDTRGQDGVERASLIGFLDNSATDPLVPLANPEDGWLGTFRGDAQKILLEDANDQNWHHLLFTVSATAQTIYYDGNVVPISSVAPFGAVNPSDFNSGLIFGDKGTSLSSSGFNFQGDLDDVALWGYALDASDAGILYASAASASVPLPTSVLTLASGLCLLRIWRRSR